MTSLESPAAVGTAAAATAATVGGGAGGLVQVGDEQAATFREFYKTYNSMSEVCFNQCVWDFGTKVVRNREDRCVMRCVQHFMDATKLIGHCFTEGHPLAKAAAEAATAEPNSTAISP